MRKNIYRNKILEVLNKRHLLDISEIQKKVPGVDHSTVFRNIKKMLKEKSIKRVFVSDKKTLYESNRKNHDHFICDDCGKIESIEPLSFKRKTFIKGEIVDIVIRGTCSLCVFKK